MNKFILVFVVAQFLSVIFGILIAIFDKKVCMTEMCDRLAEGIEKRVDSEIDPCDDFYSFSCGKILREKDRTGFLLHSIVRAGQAMQLTRLLILLHKPPEVDEPRTFRLGKKLYKLCQVNETESLQAKKLLKLTKEVGGFPAVEGDRWNEIEWTFLDAVRKFRYFGLNINLLFTLAVEYQIDSSSHQFILAVSNPTLTVPPVYMASCDEICKEEYKNDFIETVAKLGGDRDIATFDADQVFEFERKLSINIIKNPDITNLQDQTKGLTTFANISTTYDFINWSEYINIALRNEEKVPTDKFKQILVFNSGYMMSLKPIFQTTTKRTLANYMIWSAVKSLPYTLGKTRSRIDCFLWIRNRMPILLQSLYLKKYHSEPYKEFIQQLFTEITGTLKTSITDSEWMDDKTKQEASDKVREMFSRIGYPKEFLNFTLIDKHHEGVSDQEDYFSTMLSVERFSTDNHMNCLYKTVHDKKSWDLILFSEIASIYDVNAVYFNLDNSVTIFKGILDEPIFNSEWPNFINYGRIGSVVGHEVTHSLDTTGSHFDKDGKMRNWWTQASWDHFTAKAECFVDQFNNFSMFNGFTMQNLPGSLEVGENIADSGGLKLSFQAYRRFAGSLFWPELSLPRLPYTQEQMFFISFAHFYCIQYTNEMIPNLFLDQHAPSPFRVLGSVQNNGYFAQVFNCSNTSAMNPTNKCDLW